MPSRIALFTTLFFAAVVSAGAETLHLESPGPRVSLLELYTSEGCSSCPPADRWISKLRDDPRLWREVVPVVFHVDYWDYIGWNDRFASPAFSDRQREYARGRHVSTVYTPGFVLAGEEWRSWFILPVLRLDSDVQAGRLRLSVDGGQGSIEFTPGVPVPDELEVHVAILGFDLRTEVQAGENANRTLEHDFVVLGYSRFRSSRQGTEHSARFTLPDVSESSERKAIAAWLSRRDDLRPVQVVGGWLP
jgi:hypothetical protein